MHEPVVPATCVCDEIDAGQNVLDGTAPDPRVMQHAVELVDGLDIAASRIDTISSTYIQPLKTFNNVVSAIVIVRYLTFPMDQLDRHCHADPSLRSDGVGGINQCSSGASSGFRPHISHNSRQVIINQGTLDNSMFGLLLKIKLVYEFFLAGDTLSGLITMKDTLVRFAQVISNCAQFIENYSETKCFCAPFRLLPRQYSNWVSC